ncbi:MAG: response regulator transcription factor [Gammaproteobacteria bacterium]|nr:response regulator transcription factor [Gammaproteobacteria bacterium]MBU1480506.1 response regulator transcription factor [Gammaproteobacteria bacterium]
MATTKILLIDDHAMFRSGLSMVLAARMTDTEIFEAGSLNEATQDAPQQIDVILLDINLPGLNGLDGIAFLKRKWPLVPVVVLSSQDGPETVRNALARGAVCFISKADTADRIVALLNRVLRGVYAEPGKQPEGSEETQDIPQHLTPRQCEVLDLVCQGMSNKLIARRLSLSENTVRGHVQAILAFLEVSSRSEAAFAARRRGLVG